MEDLRDDLLFMGLWTLDWISYMVKIPRIKSSGQDHSGIVIGNTCGEQRCRVRAGEAMAIGAGKHI